MSAKRKNVLAFFRNKEAAKTIQQDGSLNRSLDRYAIQLIKVVGIFGIAIGIAVLIAFWYWVIKMLYKIG
jgi:hypothetical protein